MSRMWALGRRHGADALIVVAALGAALDAALADGSSPARWLTAPAVAIAVLALLGRRRLPFAAPASVWLLAAATTFVDGRVVASTFVVFVAGIAAAFLLGQLRDAVQARTGLAVVVGATAVLVANDPTLETGNFLSLAVLFSICWLAGFALRERAAQAEAAEARAHAAEREREAAARVAVAEERVRIARELHDVVAHAVSVMVLQVGAVRHRLPATLPEDRQALGDVEQAGRTALAEMRRLLGAMRREDDDAELAPQPGLADLGRLLEQVGRAGLPVRLRVDGDPVPLQHALDLSAYRIVQEGLTNALRHAHASTADVVVRYGDDQLEIEVRDDGEGIASEGGPGHGLAGVRERVKIYGGEMSAGAAREGGFVLSTRLPLREARR